MSCVLPHLLQRAKVLYRTAEFLVVGGIASFMPSFSCMMALYCPLLSRFRQVTFPQTVDKSVGKLISYPVCAPSSADRNRIA